MYQYNTDRAPKGKKISFESLSKDIAPQANSLRKGAEALFECWQHFAEELHRTDPKVNLQQLSALMNDLNKNAHSGQINKLQPAYLNAMHQFETLLNSLLAQKGTPQLSQNHALQALAKQTQKKLSNSLQGILSAKTEDAKFYENLRDQVSHVVVDLSQRLSNAIRLLESGKPSKGSTTYKQLEALREAQKALKANIEHQPTALEKQDANYIFDRIIQAEQVAVELQKKLDKIGYPQKIEPSAFQAFLQGMKTSLQKLIGYKPTISEPLKKEKVDEMLTFSTLLSAKEVEALKEKMMPPPHGRHQKI